MALTKEEFEYLDNVGVGRRDISEMDFDELRYLESCINHAVSIIPFKSVIGMEDLSGS